MNQMTIFEALDPPKNGLLHRCHLYKGNEIAYTAFPSRKGMKLLKIKYGPTMVLDLTIEAYREFIEVEGLKEVEP